MKKGAFAKIISTHWFVLKMTFDISKKRLLMEFLYQVFNYVGWLLDAGIIIQALLALVEKDISFSKVMLFLWGSVLLFLAGYLVERYFQDIVVPVTDVELYEGIHEKLYQKACQVDLQCFEDSDFYNQYMIAIRQAQVQIPKVLRNTCQIICGFVAAVAASLLVFSVDHFAIVFLIFPMIGNFVFNRRLIQRVFRMDREIIAFQRIADYVNRTVHLADYAKEMRMSNVFRLLKKQYERSVTATHQTIKRYAVKNVILCGFMQVFTFTLLFELSAIYAGYRVLVSGTMTFAQMAVFQSIMHANTWIILDFTESLMESVKDSLGVEQIQGFLNYEPKIPEDGEGELPKTPIRSIEFSHVWFGYQEDSFVLKDISFKITSGQSVAIAGYNGAGKSTLIKLLLRFYEPSQGTILVNGIDIRNYQVRAYRELFTTAFQGGKIFADTVQENVLMGRRQGVDKDYRVVWNALELAGIADEVQSWKNQAFTMLTREFSKDGMMLSGGQCQKIIAARAFAKESPIAVFDEPSSALDPIAECELFKNILAYSRDKILFFISHRLSSVQNADIVFFMEGGRITERGNHKELMRQNGNYAKLYRLQARNYQASVDKEEAKEILSQY